MFDRFAKAAYQPQKSVWDGAVAHLPVETLWKVASGDFSQNADQEWLSKFQGTDLFDRAYALLQEELAQDASNLERMQAQKDNSSASDRLRLERRMLDLELAGKNLGASDAPTTTDATQAAATQQTLQPDSFNQPKTAGVGAALASFARKNPGLVAGSIGGAALGGVRGAQETIDPTTGMPVGGGVTGALAGAIPGLALGGVAGLGAQGAIRAGLRTKAISDNFAKRGLTTPGGTLGQFANMATLGAQQFAGDVSQLGGAVGKGLKDTQTWLRNRRVNAQKSFAPPEKLPVVEPPASVAAPVVGA